MLPEKDYKKLTEPKSVALVGVTTRRGKGSNNPLEVLLEWGYQGTIYPVNPKGGTILGHRAYTSLLEVPEVPDLAVICAPRDAVPELFEQCGRKKVTMVIIIAQGFFDGDEQGKLIQEELLKAGEKYGIRVLGPNTLGVVNNFNGLCTSFIRFINSTAETGILCQSGIFVNGAAQINSGIGLLIDTGNTTDIEYSDLLGHLANDSRLKVISMHMESLRNGPKFMQTAREASALKPVIVYKTGASHEGSKMAGSHTGALSGEDRIFEEAFRQCGLFRVEDVEELNDLNKMFCTFNGIEGKRIGVVSISGGGAVMAIDACSRHGLEIAEISPHTLEQLDELFPEWSQCCNPMDVWPAAIFHGYHHVSRRVLEAFMEDPQVDSVICITGAFLDREGDFLDVTEQIKEIAAEHPNKPVVVYSYGPRFQDYASELEKGHNVLHFNSVERATRALSALYQYHHLIKKRGQPSITPPLHTGQVEVEKILAGKGPGNLAQGDAIRILEASGFPVVRWGTAESVEGAVSLAEEIGFPVTIKVVSADIFHKSDIGGLRLNIRSSLQLREAYAEMIREIGRKEPEAKIGGVLIQEHLDGGIELLLGSKRDPQFGPVVVFGSGGLYTEICEDTSLRILPLGREEMAKMVAETKVSKILAGARGGAAIDQERLIDCLVTLAGLVEANPTISEMDINPLLAREDRVVALDTRITLADGVKTDNV